MAKHDLWSLRHPSATVIQSVVALTSAAQEGSKATLTLKQASALLNHLRKALAMALEEVSVPGRCVICSAGLSLDRALLTDAAEALRHVRDCGTCGEDAWNACGTGGRRAEQTLAAIEAALGSATTDVQPREETPDA